MKAAALAYAAPLALLLAAGSGSAAMAQAAADPHHPGAATEAPRSSAPAAPGGDGRPMGPGTMGPGMMGQGMMGPGMMGQGTMGPGMMMGGQRPGMAGHGHMMKVMFAIADANGDGALSFDEVTAIHKRIFASIDADGDGKVTPEEMRMFMSE